MIYTMIKVKAVQVSLLSILNDLLLINCLKKKEKRLLESKILYSYLGQQFPEFLPQVQPQIKEIGQDVVTSLSDLKESAMVGISTLGFDDGGDGLGGYHPVADSRENVTPDSITPDLDANGLEDISPVISNKDSAVDTISPQLEIAEEGVSDFSF